MIAQGIRTTYPLTVAQRLDDLIKRVFGAPMGEVFKAPFGGVVSVAGVTYLLRDEFTTTESAPLTSPRTCEPGPGTATIIDTLNTWDIDANDRIEPNALHTGASDPSYVTEAFDRACGLAAHINFARITTWGGAGRSVYIGWSSGPYVLLDRVYRLYGGDIRGIPNGVSNNVDHDWLFVLRATGGYIIDLTTGKIRFIWSSGTTTPMSAKLWAWGGGTYPDRISKVAVFQLGAPWDSDYGLCSFELTGAQSPGQTFTHPADCFIEFYVTTVPSADQIEVWFRSPTVGTDGWRVTIDSSGNLDLDEVVGGTPTQRGTRAACVINGERILIICDDQRIAVHDGYHYTYINYNSAVTNKTETGGELETLGTAGAVSDIRDYLINLTGTAALTEIEAWT